MTPNRKFQHGLATADWLIFNAANPRIVFGPFRPVQRSTVLALVDCLDDITSSGHWDYGTARYHSECLGEYLSRDRPSGPSTGPSAGLELAEPDITGMPPIDSWLPHTANDNDPPLK